MIYMLVWKVLDLVKVPFFGTEVLKFKLLQGLITEKVGLGSSRSINTLGPQVFQTIKVRVVSYIQIGVSTKSRPWIS